MSLHVKSQDVPERKVVRTGVEGEGAMVVRRGYGNECSLMWATRAPGYHTTPHAHEAEQINYVLKAKSGSLSRNTAFSAKRGISSASPVTKSIGHGTGLVPMPSWSRPTLQRSLPGNFS